MKSLLLILFCISGLGCAGTNTTSLSGAEVITVEGQASVRGHTPFTTIMLETDQRNLYVLILNEAEKQALDNTMPTRLRITGILTVDTWNGFRYAHLKPTLMEWL